MDNRRLNNINPAPDSLTSLKFYNLSNLMVVRQLFQYSTIPIVSEAN